MEGIISVRLVFVFWRIYSIKEINLYKIFWNFVYNFFVELKSKRVYKPFWLSQNSALQSKKTAIFGPIFAIFVNLLKTFLKIGFYYL